MLVGVAVQRGDVAAVVAVGQARDVVGIGGVEAEGATGGQDVVCRVFESSSGGGGAV